MISRFLGGALLAALAMLQAPPAQAQKALLVAKQFNKVTSYVLLDVSAIIDLA